MRSTLFFFIMLCMAYGGYAQQQKAFNQNASRSNHTRSKNIPDDNGFVIRLTTDAMKSISDSIAATAVFLPGASIDYYSGNFGIGAEFGGFSNSPHFNISDYTKSIRGFTTTSITSSEWKSWFLMAGPSYRKGFGTRGNNGYPFQLSADLHGGILKMKPASFSIRDTEDGTVIADYYGQSKQSTNAENPLFALKPALRLEWFAHGGAIGLNIHASYLHAFGSSELSTYYRDLSNIKFDGLPQQEIRYQVSHAPIAESRTRGPVDNYSIGAGISIRIGSSGKSITEKGMRQLPTPNGISNAASVTRPRDAASGLATGRISMPATGNNGMAIDEQGAHRTMSPGCGPVTQSITNPDGSIEEMTFACPDDAADYSERISMNVTTGKQTQGATFGEKVNAGLHSAGSALAQGASLKRIVHRDLAARNIISGKLTWSLPGDGAGDIVTNESLHQSGDMPNRISMNVTVPKQSQRAVYGENVSIGLREASGGKAGALKKYGMLLADQGSNLYTSPLGGIQDNPLYSSNAVVGNPLYTDNGSQGTNPLFESKLTAGGRDPLYKENEKTNPLASSPSAGIAAENTAEDCDGMADVNVSLIDAETDATIATTKTGRCGDFFFGNVPDGQYIVRLTAVVNRTKGYDMHTTAKTDLLGVVSKGEQELKLVLESRNAHTSEAAWSSTKTLAAYSGDTNNRDEPVMLLGGSLPGGAVISSALRAGNPIGGIIVKGGKNPGGSMRTTQTNDRGEFYFNGLKAGTYRFLIDQTYLLQDETIIAVNHEAAENKGENPLFEGYNTNTVNPLNNPQSFVAGQPIGGIVVKGGKNPGGNMLTAKTNEKGEVEFKGLEAGNYIFTVENGTYSNTASAAAPDRRTYTGGRFTEDEALYAEAGKLTKADAGKITVIAFAGIAQTRADGTPVSNSKTIAGRLSQNNKPLKNALVEIKQPSTGDYAKIRTDGNGNYTLTVSHDTLHSVFVNGVEMGNIKIESGKGIQENGIKRTVQQDGQSKEEIERRENARLDLVNRSSGTVGVTRVLKSISAEADMDGDGEYETDISRNIDNDIILDESGQIVTVQQKAGVSTSRSNVRTRSAVYDKGDGLYIVYYTGVINNKEVAIKNVLKTKHDTAKNSVGNIR